MRKSQLSRSGPIKKRRRTKSEFARIYGSKERVEFVKSLPCAACGVVGYSENAHVGRSSGVGRKGPYQEIVPLCGWRISPGPDFLVTSGCHGLLHNIGRESFERRYNINLLAFAAYTETAWSAHIGRDTQREEMK